MTLATDPLHLVGSFDNPFAGAELELIDLARLLRAHRPERPVMLWSTRPVHARFAPVGIRIIKPFGAEYPKGGAVLLSGIHVDPGIWLQYTKPRKIRLRYNLPNHERLCTVIEQVRASASMEPELVFCSKALRWTSGLNGEIESSLIPLDRYLSNPLRQPPAYAFGSEDEHAPLTIGRVSRDVIEKHHPQDAMLYRMLAARGFRVRLMGATCLAPQLSGIAGVELLPAGAEDVDIFHRSLDVFFYRTGTFSEPYGRVVLEAMASGIPVVASLNGGYAEVIQGTGGAVIIDSQEQAFDALMTILGNTELRIRMGADARSRALELHGDAATAATLDDYATL